MLSTSIRVLASSPANSILPGRARLLSTKLPKQQTRQDFVHIEQMQTRVNDNDGFGHINNAVYYGFFDTAVNNHLAAHGIDLSYRRFVAESGCQYYSPVAYPQRLDIGLRVERLGNASVRYEIGLFAEGEHEVAAVGHFVHVYVDESGRPVTIAQKPRAILQQLAPVVGTVPV